MSPMTDQDEPLDDVETPPVPSYKIDDDGVTHINVYSRGNTLLGQLLSNFAKMSFSHPRLGRFQSVEGFWYYVKTGCKHEELRRLYGPVAKSTGQKLDTVHMPVKAFHSLICEAITCKIEQNPKLLDMLVVTALPLTHYYVSERMGARTQEFQPQHQWQLDHIAAIRRKWLHAGLED